MQIDAALHHQAAVDAHNSTWEILGKALDEISEGDAEEMTRRAYAAAYHWQRAEGSNPTNEARASWLLSRVWVVVGNGDLALQHANRCLAVCISAELTDFDLAYAHESLSIAHACLGNTKMANEHLQIASQVFIADSNDQQLFESDLNVEPWFDLKNEPQREIHS